MASFTAADLDILRQALESPQGRRFASNPDGTASALYVKVREAMRSMDRDDPDPLSRIATALEALVPIVKSISAELNCIDQQIRDSASSLYEELGNVSDRIAALSDALHNHAQQLKP